jgi:hypothetical protein
MAFFVHDLGYVGKPNMDGPEGERHPYFGACIMGALFGVKWYEFSLYHSLFLAKRGGAQYSSLCVADKMAFLLTPRWLYLPMVNWTGEIREYMNLVREGKYAEEWETVPTAQKEWHLQVCSYMGLWIEEHREIKEDLWTPVKAGPENN